MSMPRKIRCRVETVTDHGGRVYTVEMRPSIPLPSFRPGQFLHLTVDDYDPGQHWPESRVFSIASPPASRDRLQIIYAVKGRYTSRMEQVLHPGVDVWVKLPYGDFVVDSSREVVLLAGGTGISAFTAFLGGLPDRHSQPVRLVYGARHPGLWIYGQKALELAARLPNFQVVFLAENAPDDLPTVPASLQGKVVYGLGRIDLEWLWPLWPEPLKPVYYLSGPPAMLKALSDGLRARGVPPENVRMDAWE
jgi:ferredoxin-NADP reductase